MVQKPRDMVATAFGRIPASPRLRVSASVLLSILLHACVFLVSEFLFPETPVRREFKVQLAQAPGMETRRFVGRPIQVPRRAPVPSIGPVSPKGGAKPTGPALGAPVEPGAIFLPAPKRERLLEEEGIGRVAPDEAPMVLPEEALDFYTEAPTLGREGVRVQDLEMGGHRSAIVFDPEDKRNVSGFFYVPANETRIQVRTNRRTRVKSPYGISYPREVRYVVDYISATTRVEAKVETFSWDHVLTLEELRKYPLLINPGVWKEEVGNSPSFYGWVKVASVEDLGEYLRDGGFAVVRGAAVFAPVERYLRGLMGRDALFSFDINEEEPLFEAFLEFEDMERPYIRGWGLKIRNRIAMLSGDLQFKVSRSSVSVGSGGYTVSSIAERRTFFMFNAILYALTQPGSIGRQYVTR